MGDSYDNALAETLVGLYKNECVKVDGPFRTIDQLELATLSWVHWFNENRLHSSLGYLTPTEYEDLYYRENSPQQQPLSGENTLHKTRGDSRREQTPRLFLVRLPPEFRLVRHR